MRLLRKLGDIYIYICFWWGHTKHIVLCVVVRPCVAILKLSQQLEVTLALIRDKLEVSERCWQDKGLNKSMLALVSSNLLLIVFLYQPD